MHDHQAAFLISKEDISNVLSHLIGIVEKRHAIPQLAHIKIEPVDSSKIKFIATDMDISITETIAINTSNMSAFTLQAATLYDIVKKFPAKSIMKFQMQKSNIEITADGIFFALPFLEADNFPAINEENFASSFTLSADEFTQLFNKTKFAISTDECRYNITTLLLYTDNGELRSVTTDCHKLALTNLQRHEINDFSILLSRKTVLEIVKLFAKDKVEIFIADNKAKFVSNNIVLTTKLVAAKFPNYQDIVPKDYKRVMTINKEALTAAVDRVSAICIGNAKSVRLHFTDNLLKISTSNSDSSNAHEIVNTDYRAEDFDICFNYSYLLEILHHVDAPEVKIHCNDSKDAAVINDANTTYIIMPMSL